MTTSKTPPQMTNLVGLALAPSFYSYSRHLDDWLVHLICYIAKSQNLHFCCFRAMAYIRAVKLSAVLSI